MGRSSHRATDKIWGSTNLRLRNGLGGTLSEITLRGTPLIPN